MSFTITGTRKGVSENRRLIPGRGRLVAGNDYRDFKKYAWALSKVEAAKNDSPMIIGPAWAHIMMFDECRRPDVAAYVKPLLDAVQGSFYRNDHQIDRLLVERIPEPGFWRMDVGAME